MLPIYVNVSFSCFCLKKCFKLSSFSLLSLFRPSSTVNLSENNFLFSPKFYSSSQFSSFSLITCYKDDKWRGGWYSPTLIKTVGMFQDLWHEIIFLRRNSFWLMKVYVKGFKNIFFEMQTKCITIGRSSVRTLSSVKKWCQSQPLMVLPKHLNWLQIQSCVG